MFYMKIKPRVNIKENIKYIQKWELLRRLEKNMLHQCCEYWGLLLLRLENNVLNEDQVKNKSKYWRKC